MIEVVDFEASSLGPDSYPIEIGWTEGSKHHSYLIRPYAMWTDWDDYAENEIHRISREQLMDEGLPPDEVMELANQSIGAGVIWCDGGIYDLRWLAVLERCSGVRAKFSLGSVQKLLWEQHNVPAPSFYDVKQQLTDPARLHRAGYDAHIIKRAALLCMGVDFG